MALPQSQYEAVDNFIRRSLLPSIVNGQRIAKDTLMKNISLDRDSYQTLITNYKSDNEYHDFLKHFIENYEGKSNEWGRVLKPSLEKWVEGQSKKMAQTDKDSALMNNYDFWDINQLSQFVGEKSKIGQLEEEEGVNLDVATNMMNLISDKKKRLNEIKERNTYNVESNAYKESDKYLKVWGEAEKLARSGNKEITELEFMSLVDPDVKKGLSEFQAKKFGEVAENYILGVPVTDTVYDKAYADFGDIEQINLNNYYTLTRRIYQHIDKLRDQGGPGSGIFIPEGLSPKEVDTYMENLKKGAVRGKDGKEHRYPIDLSDPQLIKLAGTNETLKELISDAQLSWRDFTNATSQKLNLLSDKHNYLKSDDEKLEMLQAITYARTLGDGAGL